MNFRILNGLKRALIFKVSCLLFEISGQRFAKFAIDLNDAIRQLRKASLECFRDVLVLSHVLRHQWRPANIKKLSDSPTGSSALVSGSLAQVRCCCPLQTCGSQTPSGQPPASRVDLNPRTLGKGFRLASSHTRSRCGHRWWCPVGVASLAHSLLPYEPADLHRALRGGLQRP